MPVGFGRVPARAYCLKGMEGFELEILRTMIGRTVTEVRTLRGFPVLIAEDGHAVVIEIDEQDGELRATEVSPLKSGCLDLVDGRPNF